MKGGGKNMKSSPENRELIERVLSGAEDRVPDDFTYGTLEAWKYAHMSHGEILDFVNEKKRSEA